MLTQKADVLKVLSNDNQPSPVAGLKAKLADVQAQAEKYVKAFETDPNPSPRLVASLKGVEAQEAALLQQIETETAKSSAMVPPLKAYEALRQVLPVPTLEVKDRAQLRNRLMDVVERIDVQLGQDKFVVHFKGGNKPLGVELFKP